MLGTLCCVTLLGTAFRVAANDNKSLEETLKAKYEVTKLGIDHLRVTKPGTVFVLQQDGVYANPSTEAGSLTTKIVSGRVIELSGFGAAFFSKNNDRSLKAGTKVYVTHIWVRDKEIRFDIITADTDEVAVHGSSRETRYAATVAFQFPDGYSVTGEADAVKKIVDTVLLPETEVQASQTKTVALGQTQDQVKSILGAPDKILDLGQKVIYVYKDIKVIFVDGKVSDIQ